MRGENANKLVKKILPIKNLATISIPWLGRSFSHVFLINVLRFNIIGPKYRGTVDQQEDI